LNRKTYSHSYIFSAQSINAHILRPRFPPVFGPLRHFSSPSSFDMRVYIVDSYSLYLALPVLYLLLTHPLSSDRSFFLTPPHFPIPECRLGAFRRQRRGSRRRVPPVHFDPFSTLHRSACFPTPPLFAGPTFLRNLCT